MNQAPSHISTTYARRLARAAAVALVTLAACSDPLGDPLPEYFPGSVGDSWTYSVEHRIAGRTDTVRIEVIGTTTGNEGRSAALWEITSSAGTRDTDEVVVGGDSVSIHPRNPARPRTLYRVPFVVGARWSSLGGLLSDTSSVAPTEAVQTPGGSFAAAFRIDRSYGASNAFTRDTTWIAPHRGMVRMVHITYGDSNTTTYDTWELITSRVQ